MRAIHTNKSAISRNCPLRFFVRYPIFTLRFQLRTWRSSTSSEPTAPKTNQSPIATDGFPFLSFFFVYSYEKGLKSLNTSTDDSTPLFSFALRCFATCPGYWSGSNESLRHWTARSRESWDIEILHNWTEPLKRKLWRVVFRENQRGSCVKAQREALSIREAAKPNLYKSIARFHNSHYEETKPNPINQNAFLKFLTHPQREEPSLPRNAAFWTLNGD